MACLPLNLMEKRLIMNYRINLMEKRLIMNYRKQIELSIETCPKLPTLCRNLFDQLQDPDIDFTHLERQLQYDPGITSNILRLANSAYFGASGTVNSLPTAMMRLGLRRIWELVMASFASQILLKSLRGYELHSRDLLKHSVWVAIASEEMARLLGFKDLKLLFTAGLLHDMGKIILDPFVSKEQSALLQLDHLSFEQREEIILGMDHAQAGQKLMEKWNIPQEITSAVRWHHQPDSAESFSNIARMIHIADIMAYSEGIGAGIDGLKYRFSSQIKTDLGLKFEDVEYVASKTLDKMNELEALLT